MDIIRDKRLLFLILVSIFLIGMFLLGQTLALFNYDYVVSIGMQESQEEISEVGIAFAKGFGFSDTVIYIPLLIFGIIGLLKRKRWGKYSMFGAMAISVYWPLVHLYAIFIEREAIALAPDKYLVYPIALPLISLFGLWGMWYLYKK